ncbi:unnamed protein product, partial [Meganyctiphanes norvegica]
PKARPAQLSKYRRRTANVRERHRLKEMNVAFESLRAVLPPEMGPPTNSSTSTKITTLRQAVDYIQALTHVLEDEHSNSKRDGSKVSNYENNILNSRNGNIIINKNDSAENYQANCKLLQKCEYSEPIESMTFQGYNQEQNILYSEFNQSLKT